MLTENLELTGYLFAFGLAAAGGYYTVLRIREMLREKPDPKLTYATKEELEHLRADFLRSRGETRRDVEGIDDRLSRGQTAALDLIHKNAEHIAALIAQVQLMTQRLSELSVKTDRMHERQNERRSA